MKVKFTTSKLRLVEAKETEVGKQIEVVDAPNFDIEIRNLAAALSFILDASSGYQYTALIGYGDEITNELAIRNWLKSRYPNYANLPVQQRIDKAADDLIECITEIIDRF